MNKAKWGGWGRKKEQQSLSYQIPVNVSKEWMTHDVSKACLRVAAETLLGILWE